MEEVTIFQKQRWGHSVSKRAHRIIKLVNSSGSSESRRHSNKQDLRASGFSLLPLALRPGLLLVGERNDAKNNIDEKNLLGKDILNNNILKSFVLLFITLVAAFIIQNSYVGSVSAASLTLTIPSGISVDVTPSESASFSKSDKSTLSVKTDANYGYNLSIKVKDNTNSNSLVNGTSKLVSISSPLSEEQFNTTASTNTWGYLPSKFNSNDNTNFQPGPSDSDSTLDKTSGPNSEVVNNYDITLGVKTDNSLMSGTYKNTFVLTASANTVSYTINYNLNSGSWTETSPQTGTTSETSVNISSVTPTRSNYTFEGWCSVAVTSNDSTNPTCSGTKYSKGGVYNLTNGTNNLDLYAMWKSSQPTTMQSFGSYCSSMTTSQTLSLTDTRDNKIYTVAKLNDGKCWMTKNLEIAGKNLTSADSDVASNFNLPASSTSGFSKFDVTNVYVDPTYGGYYTWYAATAGEGTSSKSSGDTSHSICPKGWKLPSKSEYDTLVSKQGSAKMTQSPANFMLSGYYYDGSAGNQSSDGHYWSSTASDGLYAYGLGVSSSYAYTSSDFKYFGVSVRCVARQ